MPGPPKTTATRRRRSTGAPAERPPAPPRAPRPPRPGRAAPDASLAEAIVACSPDAILVADPDGRIVRANDAAARLFGEAAERLVGRAADALLEPADRAAAREIGGAALADGPQRLEARIRTAEGVERIAAIGIAALRRGGRTLGAVYTLRDVTDASLAHAELARSEARYRKLFEGASDAVLTLDASACFTTINHAGEEISGLPRERLVGASFAPLIVPEEAERALYEFQAVLAGEPRRFESQVMRADGEIRHISVNASCVELGEEVLCLVRDVTEQKLLQQQLIQSEKMGAIGQLVSGVAHELNNPLASISAFAQLVLSDSTLPAPHRHSADIIGNESRRAARIVNNLLTFARQHRAEKVAADINKVLEDTLELREYELGVRGISVVRDYDPALRETMADVYQLQQVFLNLITNAEQAMAGERRARHRLVVRTRGHADAIRVEVEDTGPGSPPGSLERLFNPFYTTKPTGQGTGLGLSISLGIVSEHGGRIWAENIFGGGSRFVVEIPQTAPTRRSGEERAAPEPSAPGRLRVLVVDDEEPLRMALEIWLKRGGHEVTTSASGVEALALASTQPFDALLLDIRMPDLSGEQIYTRLSRERPEAARRIIFLTGDIVSAELRRFLEDSGQPFFAKPFDFAELARALPSRGA